jgi:YfiH family protein
MSAYLNANWLAPGHVRALTTTRQGGVSKAPYEGNNLAMHVGDNESDVLANRRALISNLQLPADPEWLEQTHSTDCVIVEQDSNRNADAAITTRPNTVLAILTADCLPIVLTNHLGTEVAAIHAGWRGLANGIIESTIHKMQSPAATLIAWVGPAICQDCYQTGADVERQFISQYPFSQPAFLHNNQAIYANLPDIAEKILTHIGVSQVFQSEQCSYETTENNHPQNKYYSYRHQSQTGRMATLIWFDGADNCRAR